LTDRSADAYGHERYDDYRCSSYGVVKNITTQSKTAASVVDHLVVVEAAQILLGGLMDQLMHMVVKIYDDYRRSSYGGEEYNSCWVD
jgi:hypothetical protein